MALHSASSAQNGINYKALVKDDLGNVIAEESIAVEFSILLGSSTGNIVYQETHQPTTNSNGIVIVNIGEGTPITGTFSNIDWDSDSHFLNVKIDIGAGLVDLGTSEFAAVPYALSSANVSGLEALDEGNGLGWRLIDRDPANYGNIGLSAADLSTSFDVGSSHGAIGSYSFAAGLNTIASGSDSAAFGFETEATAFQSTAMGNGTTASGGASTALGSVTTASAEASTAMGSFTIADDENGTVVGTYNDNTITTTSLFQVGNGTSNANRSNAFSIEANGTITAPSFDIGEITDDKALITKEYLEANTTSGTGLEAIDEGNGLGWRLIDRDEALYGTINIGAVDFSTSQQNTDTNGATGEYAFASGVNTLASGNRSTALGNFTTASGFAATAMGSSSSATADGAVALGVDNTASGFGAIAMGGFTISDDEYGTVVGVYNDNTLTTTSLFQVGNGTSSLRSNAFNIDEDGTITAPSFDISEITDGKALITKEYADANYAGGGSGTSPTGLETIDEGFGIGWRLIGRNPNNYGSLGSNAVDLSWSDTTSSDFGATSNTAVAMGYQTEASGNYSTAMGYETNASQTYSTALGQQTTASGSASIAMGFSTSASGGFSTAAGAYTTASANYTTAMGFSTIADDDFLAVVGKFNDNTTTTTSLFQVGNGIDNTNRSNAFNIDEDGTITAPSFDISEITDAKALITKEYADANYAGGGSGASPTGLEAIDEGNGIGWRLIGRDPSYYGNIGVNAIDLSINNLATSSILGASGSNSFAAGIETLASGNGSVAMGFGSNATTSFSTALGFQTIADDINVTVVGKYNDNTATTTSLFQVGNGTSNVSRSNALTIDESGQHTIISSAFGLVINSSLYGIYIDGSGDDGILIENSSGKGIEVFNSGSDGILVNSTISNGVRTINATNYGGHFTGDIGGVRATSANDANPDIVLGGTFGGTATDDDGIISSDPSYSSSDIFLRSYDAVTVFLDYDNNETGQFEIKAGDGTEVFEVRESGNATLAGTLTQNSDRRLKKDITAINYGLNEILQLQPKAYNWKNRETEKKSLGLIAQEVQLVISEIVNTQDDEQKTLGISYTELIPVLIKAIQEQQAIIDSQKQVITSQEQTNTKQTEVLQALLDRVEALEKQSKKSHIELAEN